MAPRAMPPGALLESAAAARQQGDWRGVRQALQQAADDGAALPAESVELLALASWWCGDVPAALQLTERAHQMLLAEDRAADAAECAATMSILALLRGDATLASGWLSRARRLLDGLDAGRAHALVHFVDAFAAIEGRDLASALSEAAAVQQVALRLAEPTLAALGLMAEGVARVRSGEVHAGLALLDEAMLPVVGGQVLPEYAGAIYCMVIGVCGDLADLPRARAWTSATERWAGQFSDAVMFVGVCRVHRSLLRVRAGQWADAEREALQTCGDMLEANRGVAAEGWYLVGECRRMRAQHGPAADAYARARSLGRPPEPGSALLQLQRGEPEAAWAAIAAALDDATDPFVRARLALASAEIALATGRPDEAASSADELESLAAAYPSEGLSTMALHARGMAQRAAARPAEALESLAAACRAYDRERCPYDAARVRLVMAGCHRALGEHAAAEALQRAGQRALTELGLDATAAAPGDEPLPAGLTAREAEVLAAVAAGASNREVAEQLHVASKTISRHLSNIFLKLDVHSRTAAAAWAHAHRIGDRMRRTP